MVDVQLEEYIRFLAVKAQEESAVFPVDRKFLEKHLTEILSFDRVSFIYHNLELAPITYVNRLFVCLPELWVDVTVDDLISICSRLTKVYPYFSLIKFTYKYIEIDILDIVLSAVKQREQYYLKEILEYLDKQWNVLVKSESDFEDFEDGFIEVDNDEWMYIKQKLLIDARIKPAFLTPFDVHESFDKIIGRFRSGQG